MNECEKKEFNQLGNRMLELYEKADQNGSFRKILCAEDDNFSGNMIMFFQGSKEDASAVRDFLNNRMKK